MTSCEKQFSALIFKVNQLGDNVVFLPAIQRLAREAAFSRLVLWTTPLAAPLYRNISGPLRLEISSREEFYPAWKSPRALLDLTIRARAPKADLALVAEDMGNTAYLLALLSGAKRRIGIRPPYLKVPLAITDDLQLLPDAPAAEKAWALGRALADSAGGRPWPRTPPAPDLSHLILPEKKSFDVLIHPGASRSYQRWHASRYAELATRLSGKFRVGVFQTPEWPTIAGEEFEVLQPQSLDELVSHIANTSIFVANNSGPMHIASGLGTPSVILVGPSARSWNPYWYADRFLILRDENLPCIACDPPGLPILETCTNRVDPMACMKFWTVDTVESHVRDWYARWKDVPRAVAR